MTSCLLCLVAMNISSKEALQQDMHHGLQLYCCKHAAQLRD